MLKEKQINSIQGNIRTVQIICFALIAGVSVAGLLLAAVAINWDAAHTNLTMFPLIGLAMMGICAVNAFIIPTIVANAGVKVAAREMDDNNLKLDSPQALGRLLGVFQSSTIIRYALIEGASFANLMFMMIDPSWICITVYLTGIAFMVLFFPRRNQILSWLEEQISSAGQSKSF